MSSSRLRIIIVCFLIGAFAGTVFQALRITDRPQEFRSLAKFVAYEQPVNHDASINVKELQQGLYATIIETVETDEMKRRALERVKALNPDLKECDIEIRGVHIKGSDIINIQATGPEPKYTRIFLDALLDEYMAWRMSMLERMDGKPRQRPLQDSVAVRERASPATEYVEDWRLPIATGAGGGGFLGGLVGFMLFYLFSMFVALRRLVAET